MLLIDEDIMRLNYKVKKKKNSKINIQCKDTNDLCSKRVGKNNNIQCNTNIQIIKSGTCFSTFHSVIQSFY